MRGIRALLPLVLLAATIWWACDSRTVTTGATGADGAQVASVQVSLWSEGELFYSQSTRSAIADTIRVLVLDANRSAMANVPVAVSVQSSFGGAVTPVSGSLTDDSGQVRFAFRVHSADAAFSGDQTISFVVTAGNRTGAASLTLREQSEIQLRFLDPAPGDTLYRHEDASGFDHVRVYAFREVVESGTPVQVPVSNVELTFRVIALTEGARVGAVSYVGSTDASGVAEVVYSNSSVQPEDLIQLRFQSWLTGNRAATEVHSDVYFSNELGFRLVRILPASPNLRADLLCSDSTRFVYQYRGRNGEVISGARFEIEPSMGQLIDENSYSMVTNESGQLSFQWRSCEDAGGTLYLNMTNTQTGLHGFSFPVADPRPIELLLTSPSGDQLEIDSECLPENAVNVRALLRYGDNQNPINGKTINFSATYGVIGGSAITDLSGVAAVTWQNCDESDSGSELTLTAAYLAGRPSPILSISRDYAQTLPLGVPSNITLSSVYGTLPDPDSGSLETEVTASVFNSQNQRLGAGLSIGFRTNGIGGISAAAFTDANGQARATFVMNENTGISQIRAFYPRPNTAPAETLWSQPSTITVNSGLPSNLTLSTATPRIQIRGYGSSSVAQVRARVVDASGSTVTINTPVRFTLETSPAGVFLTIPGEPGQYFRGDTLTTMTTNGIAQMTVNAGNRPGTVQVGAFAAGEGYDVYSNAALVSIVAGPPAYGTIDFDATGDQAGAGVWRVRWSVHLWDQFSNDVQDSTAVWFSLDPPDICSMEGFALTGVNADGEEGIPGIAEDWMTYHCSNIGDTLNTIIASSAGVIPEIDPWSGDTTWVPGVLNIFYTDPNDPNDFFQVPFQSGDRDDNLTVIGQVDQVPFSMAPCNQVICETFVVQATLVDGYGCPVANQPIQFWSSLGGEFDPPVVITNEQGVALTELTVCSNVLDNLGTACPEPNDDCWRYGTYTLNYGAYRLPDGNPQSNEASVILSRPCQ
jgi:hypothetical protein